MSGQDKKYEVIVIGGGPAGLTAGIYLGRGHVKALLVEQLLTGGQTATADLIENYPGFPQGVDGEELSDLMLEQALKFGLQLEYTEITGLEKNEDCFKLTGAGGEEYYAQKVILAMGAEPRKLGMKNEEKLVGKGISYCATCDGAFFNGGKIAVIGGGNTAIEDSLYLLSYAKEIVLVHRRDSLRADPILQQRVLNKEKITFAWDSVVKEIKGEQKVEGIVLENVKTGELKMESVDGVFIAIGREPKGEFLQGLVERDPEGYIITDRNKETSCPGLFAAGDICQTPLRQVITAAADGAIAANCATQQLLSN